MQGPLHNRGGAHTLSRLVATRNLRGLRLAPVVAVRACILALLSAFTDAVFRTFRQHGHSVFSAAKRHHNIGLLAMPSICVVNKAQK